MNVGLQLVTRPLEKNIRLGCAVLRSVLTRVTALPEIPGLLRTLVTRSMWNPLEQRNRSCLRCVETEIGWLLLVLVGPTWGPDDTFLGACRALATFLIAYINEKVCWSGFPS